MAVVPRATAFFSLAERDEHKTALIGLSSAANILFAIFIRRKKKKKMVLHKITPRTFKID